MQRHRLFISIGGGGTRLDEYFTLKQQASDEYVVKHSRFISCALPVQTQEQAVAFINEVRAKHWDAKHNVYAYVLRDGQIKRYSDDGEPQGTAGMPVLDVLLKEELTDCCVVVTRYFGGILLGGGGLVRAYSHSAKLGVDAAQKIKMALCVRAVCECDYGFYGKLSGMIPEAGGTVEAADFTDKVSVTFTMPQNLYDGFCAAVFDASLGKVSPREVETLFAEAK